MSRLPSPLSSSPPGLVCSTYFVFRVLLLSMLIIATILSIALELFSEGFVGGVFTNDNGVESPFYRNIHNHYGVEADVDVDPSPSFSFSSSSPVLKYPSLGKDMIIYQCDSRSYGEDHFHSFLYMFTFVNALYADIHSYTYVFFNSSWIHTLSPTWKYYKPAWCKVMGLKVLLELYPTCKYIVYVDSDAHFTVTNLHRPLEPLFLEKKFYRSSKNPSSSSYDEEDDGPLIMVAWDSEEPKPMHRPARADDGMGLNTGVFAIRNDGNRIFRLLDDWISYPLKHARFGNSIVAWPFEQLVLSAGLYFDPKWNSSLLILPPSQAWNSIGAPHIRHFQGRKYHYVRNFPLEPKYSVLESLRMMSDYPERIRSLERKHALSSTKANSFEGNVAPMLVRIFFFKNRKEGNYSDIPVY